MVGVIQAFEFQNGNATNDQAFVFQAPIVAVIGGVLLLTGGYASIGGVVLGTALSGIISAKSRRHAEFPGRNCGCCTNCKRPRESAFPTWPIASPFIKRLAVN